MNGSSFVTLDGVILMHRCQPYPSVILIFFFFFPCFLVGVLFAVSFSSLIIITNGVFLFLPFLASRGWIIKS